EEESSVERIARAGRVDRAHARRGHADVEVARDPAAPAASAFDYGAAPSATRACVEPRLRLVHEHDIDLAHELSETLAAGQRGVQAKTPRRPDASGAKTADDARPHAAVGR